uniref:Keratin-associated protein 5-1-like n=1 Tax=Nicotiana sylvestris TaxID=4096 RepID=A0A1U7YKE5_NICSY|nr:PREDICTED: keratin-associated protein 5-1-like [Nicotiana sylvestris]
MGIHSKMHKSHHKAFCSSSISASPFETCISEACVEGVGGSELVSRSRRPEIDGVPDEDGCDPYDCDIAVWTASGCDTDCCDPSGCDTDGCDPCGCDMDRCDPCDDDGCDPRGSEAGGLYVGRIVLWPYDERPGVCTKV